MAEGEDLLVGGGLVPGGRADSDGLAGFKVRELKLESESVPGGAGVISDLKLVSVSVHLVDTDNLGDNIEVSLLGLGVLEGNVHILGEDVVGGEVRVGPLAKGGEEGGVLLLEGGSVTGVVDGGEVTADGADDGGLIGGEESP